MSVKQVVKNGVRLPIELLAAHVFGEHKQNSKQPKLWVMMYHRILPKSDARYAEEEPGMVVEPETLRDHIRFLKQEFTLIPLQEWVDRSQKGLPLPAKACALTFDDGWLDNYEYALPILQEEQAPATLFAVAGMMNTSRTFWPNRIAHLLNTHGDSLNEFDWLAKLQLDQGPHNEVSAQAIYQLKNYSDPQILDLLDDAETKLGVSQPKHPVLMSWDQLREFGRSDFLDIGSHTCKHTRLRSDLDTAVLLKEISESKGILEQQLDKRVDLFCYPNGDFCPDAVKAVGEHYSAAVTTQRGVNTSSTPLATLHRFGVHQHASYNRRKLLARIANWP